MKHYINNKIHKTGDTITIGGIKYHNCTDSWYKKHGAIDVIEINDDGVSGLYTIDEDGNAVEPYTDQVITHTEKYEDEDGKEQTYEWTEPVPHKYFLYVDKEPVVNQKAIEEEQRVNEIRYVLDDTTELTKALERLVSANGVTDEDKNMANVRILLRDQLGKLVVENQPNGDYLNPIPYTVAYQ